MKLFKKQLNLLVGVLAETKPHFVEARLRDKVIKLLLIESTQFDEDRVKICKDLCIKDEKGEPLMKGNIFDFTPENMTKFQEEFKILSDEEIKLPLDGNEQQRLLKLIETTEYLPKVGEVEMIDEILGEIKPNEDIPSPKEFLPE